MRRSRLALLLIVSLAGAGATAAAQVPADSGAAPYARARALVRAGDGAVGRAVVDSLLEAATPGTPAYAEALYWRARLAERGADAERDYRLLAVEYGFSPRGADALVALAQLAIVRGTPSAAREPLDRLLRDYPDAGSQARGQYWLARAHLLGGNALAACGALDAAATAAETGSDVARQVAALRPQVANCETFLAGARPTPPTPAAPTPAAASTAASTTRAPAPSSPAPSTATPAGRFTVQVAAYDTRAGAEALAARLAQGGLVTRVVAPNGDRPPFRVQVGRYATRAEATAAVRELRGRRITGFVTNAGPE